MALPRFEDLVDEEPSSGLPSFDSLQDETTPEVSKTESGLRGGAQGLSFGFADELTGALQSMIGDKTYEQARDESRANYTKAEEANPKTYMAGEIGGAVLPAVAATLASGGSAAPAAAGGIAKMIAPTTIKGMAALGAMDALGHSESDLTKGDIGGAAKDTARGAVTGAVAGGIGKGISAAGENLLPALKKLATEGGESALGLTTGSIKKMGTASRMGVDKAEEVAEFALKPNQHLAGDSIVGGLKDNTRAMYDKAELVKNAAGEDTGNILKMMDTKSPVAAPVVENIYQAISKARNEIAATAPTLGETATNQYQKALNDFEALATDPKNPLTHQKLGEFKKAIGDIAYKHGSPVESKAALQDVYTAVNQGLEQAVEHNSTLIGKPELLQAYKAGKNAYDMSLRAMEGLEGKAAKEAGGKWIGFGDVMAGGLGSAVGGVPGMIAAVGAKRAIDARGAQTIGKVSYTVEQKLEHTLASNPEILGKYLPAIRQAAQRGQLAATNYVLQQRDPEYAEFLKKINEREQE